MAESLISAGQHINLLPTLTITTAVTNQLAPAASSGVNAIILPRHCIVLHVQANFVYGSGGTNATAYLQTSLDGGVTWIDIMAFQFTTASQRRFMTVLAETAVATPATPTDATLTANTSVAGVIGDRVRLKYTTTGTYAGGTTLQVSLIAKSMVVIQ